jgi:RNA polymerase sigma-70 factor (ECF subfamily)
MDHPPDSLLNRLRQTGSRADWDRFIDLYRPLLEYWARRMLPPDEARDLVQDVLVLVMSKLSTFGGHSERSFLAWLRTVMRNRRRDLARRALIRPGAADPSAFETLADEEDDLAQAAEAEDRQFLIRRALQIMQSDFEPTTWRACWESVAAGRPAAEVAAELGVSVEVVYSASYRVIRRLRHELAGAWD